MENKILVNQGVTLKEKELHIEHLKRLSLPHTRTHPHTHAPTHARNHTTVSILKVTLGPGDAASTLMSGRSSISPSLELIIEQTHKLLID